jgi:hypothetical protein
MTYIAAVKAIIGQAEEHLSALLGGDERAKLMAALEVRVREIETGAEDDARALWEQLIGSVTGGRPSPPAGPPPQPLVVPPAG